MRVVIGETEYFQEFVTERITRSGASARGREINGGWGAVHSLLEEAFGVEGRRKDGLPYGRVFSVEIDGTWKKGVHLPCVHDGVMRFHHLPSVIYNKWEESGFLQGFFFS